MKLLAADNVDSRVVYPYFKCLSKQPTHEAIKSRLRSNKFYDTIIVVSPGLSTSDIGSHSRDHRGMFSVY